MFVRTITLLLFWVPLNFIYAQWEIEFPETTRNSHYLIANPSNSSLFYAFGNDLLQFDTATNESKVLDEYDLQLQFKQETANFPTTEPHSDTYFITEQIGFLISKNRIYKTIDRGANWNVVQELSPNTQYQSSSYFTSIHFPSTTTGYAVGTADKIFKTNDAGESWDELQWSTSTAPYRRLSEVFFRTELHGFVVGYEVEDILQNLGLYRPFVLKTLDGGQTWKEINLLDFLETSDHHYGKLQAVNNTTLYLASINRNYVFPLDRLYRSFDNGETWHQVDLPGPGLVIRDMHWFSEGEGIILGSDLGFGEEYMFFKTIDGGSTWTKQELPVWPNPSFDQTFPIAMAFKGNEGIIVGSGGSVLHTKNRGDSWGNIQFARPNINDLDILDTNTSYAVGGGGLILKQTETNWDTLSPPVSSLGHIDSYLKVNFSDPQNGVILGTIRDVYETQDGGQNFTHTLISGDTFALDLAYQNDRLYVLVKDQVTQLALLKRDGTDWQKLPIANNIDGFVQQGRLQVLNDQTIWISFDRKLYKTIDGGLSWEVIDVEPLGNIFNRFHFYDTETGWIAVNDQIWKTVDGGNTWNEGTYTSEINAIPFFQVNGFTNLDENRIIAFARIHAFENRIPKDACFLSNDGGENWDLLDMPFNQETSIFGLSAWDMFEETLYLGLTNGVIVSYKESTTSIPEEHKEIPIQIYPNPVTNLLSIEHPFDQLSVQFFDVLGRLVLTRDRIQSRDAILVDDLPNGTYLLRMSQDNWQQTAKVMITK